METSFPVPVRFRFLPIRILGLLVLGAMTGSNARADVAMIRVIVENNPKVPGEARIWFPHLRSWVAANRNGIIRLPAPYGSQEVITVEPKFSAVYGPPYTRFFPIQDGIVSLRAIPVTIGIKAKADLFAENDQPAEAAVGYALFARRIQLGQTGNPSVYQREALEALARQFSVSGGYVKDGESWRASPQLVNAINARLGEGTVPADGRFSVEDFRAAADLKSLSPIVATVQEKHSSTLEK